MSKRAPKDTGPRRPRNSLAVVREPKELLQRFAGQTSVTIASGTTCAFLGDERSLREFIVADEAARELLRAGHVAYNFLFDDSMDPLTDRQLRIAVDKDPEMCSKLAEHCGKPIAHIPDPWGCHGSFADHFEEALLARLTRIGCCPTLISTARLYENGVYARIVEMVLDQNREIEAFLKERFPTYSLGALFYPICPTCGQMRGTRLAAIGDDWVRVACSKCEKSTRVDRACLRGKLSWKLDCAARWTMFAIDAEVFNKAYLEPTTGTFVVAQALSKEFFEGAEVVPILNGVVQMDRDVSGKILDSLSPAGVRSLFGNKWANDIHLTRDRVILEASRLKVYGDMSLLEFSKQVMPIWELESRQLTSEQRALLSSAQSLTSNFLDGSGSLRLPSEEALSRVSANVALALANVVDQAVALRRASNGDYDVFDRQMKKVIEHLGPRAKDVSRCMRELTGLKKGLPLRRLLFGIPESYMLLLSGVLRISAAPVRSTDVDAA